MLKLTRILSSTNSLNNNLEKAVAPVSREPAQMDQVSICVDGLGYSSNGDSLLGGWNLGTRAAPTLKVGYNPKINFVNRL